MWVSPFSLTPSRTSEVSVLCNNSVGSQRSAPHCAFCGDHRRAAPLCLPSAASSALVPLPSKRVFPPQPGLQASAPSAGGSVPSRPFPRAQEPGRSGGPAKWPVTVPIPAAPAWPKMLPAQPSLYSRYTRSYKQPISILLFLQRPRFPHFRPVFGNFSLAHWPRQARTPFYSHSGEGVMLSLTPTLPFLYL